MSDATLDTAKWYVYELTRVNRATDYGIRIYSPPYMTPEYSRPDIQVIRTPLNATWTNPYEDSEALEKNTELWQNIVKSLVKRHEPMYFRNVGLVAQMTELTWILEARHNFFKRAKFSVDGEKGLTSGKLTRMIQDMCKVYVPMMTNSTDDQGRQCKKFMRWAIM